MIGQLPVKLEEMEMAQTENLKEHYRKTAEEHEAEARYCEGKGWRHLAAVQRKLAAEWLARIV